MKDGVALLYINDGILYPVALTEEQNDTLQFTVRLLGPLSVVMDQPQGTAINLIKKK
jgi:hypothetical protein